MAFSVFNQSGNESYGVNQYVVDTDAEIVNLPTNPSLIAPGSMAVVTSSGNKYILSASYQWMLYISGGSSPTGDVHYIWDGGEVV